uniref:Uncharacterized protein n=1 Tax=Gopherus evgoodei TaxID=1825980 RepID=A0A8C5F1C2_9SAUR
MCNNCFLTLNISFPIQKGSLERLKQQWESGDALRAGPRGGSVGGRRRRRRSQTPEGRRACPAPAAAKAPRASVGAEVAKEEPRDGRRRLERFPIPWEELRSKFETPSGAAAGEVGTVHSTIVHILPCFKDFY